jgi:hypothetical protein
MRTSTKCKILIAFASELLPEEQPGVRLWTGSSLTSRTVSAATNDHDDYPLFGRILDEKETVMDGSGDSRIRRDSRWRRFLAGG